MKSVLISIKPKYCELIAAGKKTIEVRKTRPKIETPFKCYIYMTKSNLVGDRKAYKDRLAGKVIGEFVCDEIYQYTTCDAKDGVDISDGEMTRMSCLTKDEITNYELSPGYFGVFGWHISKLKIYAEPKRLREFWHCGVKLGARVSRPPQSWFYVEEV